MRQQTDSPSMPEVHSSVATAHPSLWRRMFAFAGPAYLVSVGYMDPGNWATDLEGGARFGYKLLWVLVLSNALAILLQTLSARLGIVTGRDLAQACRESYPKRGQLRAVGAVRDRHRAPATWRKCWARPSASSCCSDCRCWRACCCRRATRCWCCGWDASACARWNR